MFYVQEHCEQFIRTVPILSRDENDWDDVDTDQEDHIADEWRYVCMSRPGDGTSLFDRKDKKSLSELDHDDMTDIHGGEGSEWCDDFNKPLDDIGPSENIFGGL